MVSGISKQLASGLKVLSFHSDTDDIDQPRAIYTTEYYDDADAYPVVIMAH